MVNFTFRFPHFLCFDWPVNGTRYKGPKKTPESCNFEGKKDWYFTLCCLLLRLKLITVSICISLQPLSHLFALAGLNWVPDYLLGEKEKPPTTPVRILFSNSFDQSLQVKYSVHNGEVVIILSPSCRSTRIMNRPCGAACAWSRVSLSWVTVHGMHFCFYWPQLN